ncbi:MAG: SHOCT domain-containing protein [Eubacteriales bacterium]
MEHYQLQSDETVLYKGEVIKVDRNKKGSFMDSFSTPPTTELILTNKNIVLITRIKKMFAKEQPNVEVFPLDDVKVYDGMPQVKHNKINIEIYLTSGEIYVDFNSKLDALKFYQTAIQTLTGKSLATRGAEKVKGGIGLVDDTLGISTVDTVKGVLENGLAGTLFSGFKKKKLTVGNNTSTVKEVSEATKEIIKEAKGNSTDQKEKLTYDQQIDALNKLKALLDAGILTQEEFDAKKKEILGL